MSKINKKGYTKLVYGGGAVTVDKGVISAGALLTISGEYLLHDDKPVSFNFIKNIFLNGGTIIILKTTTDEESWTYESTYIGWLLESELVCKTVFYYNDGPHYYSSSDPDMPLKEMSV